LAVKSYGYENLLILPAQALIHPDPLPVVQCVKLHNFIEHIKAYFTKKNFQLPW
jgi:hypothetical protein